MQKRGEDGYAVHLEAGPIHLRCRLDRSTDSLAREHDAGAALYRSTGANISREAWRSGKRPATSASLIALFGLLVLFNGLHRVIVTAEVRGQRMQIFGS